MVFIVDTLSAAFLCVMVCFQAGLLDCWFWFLLLLLTARQILWEVQLR